MSKRTPFSASVSAKQGVESVDEKWVEVTVREAVDDKGTVRERKVLVDITPILNEVTLLVNWQIREKQMADNALWDKSISVIGDEIEHRMKVDRIERMLGKP